MWDVAGPFSVAGRTFIPVPLRHGTLPILGYRLGAFAYLTDCSEIPEPSWALLRGLDVLVLDGLRRRPHSTHFHIDRAVEIAGQIGATRTYFTHMSHDLAHAATCAELPPAMSLAHDGLVLEADEKTSDDLLDGVRANQAALLS